jgi:hypothetical protein
VTSKAYLVSWLGKGNIIWTPLEQSKDHLSMQPILDAPLRAVLNAGAGHHESLRLLQQFFDPSLAALNQIKNIVEINSSLGVLGVGLQIATLVSIYQMTQKLDRIDEKLKVLGGKFELHFLDQSICHFLSCHEKITGLLSASAAALEEDCHNALDELISIKSLNIPGYLKLKLASVAHALENYNRFLYAVLHNGSVPIISDERITKFIDDGGKVHQANIVGGFVPQKRLLEIWSEKIQDKKWKFTTDDTRFDRAMDRLSIQRTLPVSLVAMLLKQSLALSNSIEDQLQSLPNHSLVIKTINNNTATNSAA